MKPILIRRRRELARPTRGTFSSYGSFTSSRGALHHHRVHHGDRFGVERVLGPELELRGVYRQFLPRYRLSLTRVPTIDGEDQRE